MGKKTRPNHPDIWWFQAAIAEKAHRSGDALAPWTQSSAAFRIIRPFTGLRRANILSKMNRATAALNTGARPWRSGEQRGLHPGPAGTSLVKNGDFFGIRPAHGATSGALLGHKRYGYYRISFFNLNCHPTYPGADSGNISATGTKTVKPGLPAKNPLKCRARARAIRLACLPDFKRHSMLLHGPIFRGQRNCGTATISSLCLAHFDRAKGQDSRNVQESRRITGWRFRPWATTSWSAKFALRHRHPDRHGRADGQ